MYLVMGMTPTEYWEKSPFLAVAFRKAYRLKRQVENEKAWLQGMYIYDAFAVCLANALSKQGSKKQNYAEKPFDIFPLTEREKKIRQAQENAKMEQAMKEIMRKQRQRKKQKQAGD